MTKKSSQGEGAGEQIVPATEDGVSMLEARLMPLRQTFESMGFYCKSATKMAEEINEQAEFQKMHEDFFLYQLIGLAHLFQQHRISEHFPSAMKKILKFAAINGTMRPCLELEFYNQQRYAGATTMTLYLDGISSVGGTMNMVAAAVRSGPPFEIFKEVLSDGEVLQPTVLTQLKKTIADRLTHFEICFAQAENALEIQYIALNELNENIRMRYEEDVIDVIALYRKVSPSFVKFQKQNPTAPVFVLAEALMKASAVLKEKEASGDGEDKAQYMFEIEKKSEAIAELVERMPVPEVLIDLQNEATLLRRAILSSNEKTVLGAKERWQKFLGRHKGEFSTDTLKQYEAQVMRQLFENLKGEFLIKCEEHEKSNEPKVMLVLKIYKIFDNAKLNAARVEDKKRSGLRKQDESAVEAVVRIARTIVSARAYAEKMNEALPQDTASMQKAIMEMQTLESRFFESEWQDEEFWWKIIREVVDEIYERTGGADPNEEVKELLSKLPVTLVPSACADHSKDAAV